MARDRNTTPDHEEGGAPSKRDRKSSKSITDDESDSEPSTGSESEHENGSKRSEVRRKGKRKRSRSRSKSSRRRARDDRDEDSYSSSSTESDESYSGTDSYSSEERRQRRREKEKERKRRREKEKEKERRRKRRKEKEREERKKKEKRKKKNKDRGKTGAVTDSWGKYGIIRETDMWNKRPEFTAWLQEVKQVNLESLPNWEEKQLFKDFMEDHNTATFPSKKYYDLDVYYRRQMIKEMKKGPDKVLDTERTVFDDEEQRRLELLRERERQKEKQLQELKNSMKTGMAQAMKEQAQLKEEMAYQYKLGNFEAAAAIQRRLDPDVAM